MSAGEKKNHFDAIYARAVLSMRRAYTADQYKDAAEMFSGIAGYKDAAELARECRKTAEEALRKAGEERKNRVCDEIRQKMAAGEVSEYENALILLKTVPDWEEAAARAEECRKGIAEITAREEAEKLERERQAEIARQKAERIAKRKKMIRVAFSVTLGLIVTSALVWKYVIGPAIRYNEALALMDSHNIVEAYEALIALDDYKDSADKAASIFSEYKIEKLKVAGAGDYVFFGAYEQDGNTSNGKEEVEWLVLEATDERVLVISKYALDRRTFNEEWQDVTWEMCALREWLNNDFINAAFSAEQQAQIPMVSVSADTNPEYGTEPGNATQDKVFLLSIAEADKYFSSAGARVCEPTDYAVANGARESKSGSCKWWLRTPGYGPRIVTNVLDGGKIFEGGSMALDGRIAVRPALWIERNT